jgi:hypothetical protein
MEEQIDNLQQKCFALLGTINGIKTNDVSLSEPNGVNQFNTDMNEMMKAMSAFFSGPVE